jgi:hypothetical protein
MIIVTLSEDAADFLAAYALRGLTDAAAELAQLDPHSLGADVDPHAYPRAQRQLAAAVEAVYALRHPGGIQEQRPRPSLADSYEPASLQLMRDHGLDPMKELGPHVAQASHPSCVHGRRFSEPCERCAALGLDDASAPG